MSARGDGPLGGGTSKPAVFHRDSNSKRVQRSNSNLSATSVTASASGGSLVGVGESKFVREKRKMVSDTYHTYSLKYCGLEHFYDLKYLFLGSTKTRSGYRPGESCWGGS